MKTKLVKCPACKCAYYVEKVSKKKVICPYCESEVILIKAKKSENIEIKIVVPVYYAEMDNGRKIVDEDGIRDEFEIKLKEIIEAINYENKNI